MYVSIIFWERGWGKSHLHLHLLVSLFSFLFLSILAILFLWVKLIYPPCCSHHLLCGFCKLCRFAVEKQYFFCIISRAFYYCLTCHADVKSPELIKECECSRGTKMQYFITLHMSHNYCYS